MVFWILGFHERGAFIPNSYIFLCNRMICKNPKKIFGKNSLNVNTKCKATFKKNFNSSLFAMRYPVVERPIQFFLKLTKSYDEAQCTSRKEV